MLIRVHGIPESRSANNNLRTLTGNTSEDGSDFSTTLTYTPDFAATTTAYTATVPSTVTHLQLTPTVADPAADVRVGKAVDALQSVGSGTASQAIALAAGLNTIRVRVTPANTVAAKVYTLRVTRQPISLIAEMPDMRVNAGESAPAIDLSDYFHGAATLTYSASATPNAVASVSLGGSGSDNDMLTVRGEIGGNAQITVTARDADGNEAQQSFTAMVRSTYAY